MKHTPGPWNIDPRGNVNCARVVIADTYGIQHEDRLANAQLIACAPELVDAIRDMLNGLYALRDHARESYGPDNGTVEQKLIDIGIAVLKKAGV